MDVECRSREINVEKIVTKETDAEKEGDAENEQVEKKKTEIERFIRSRTGMWRLEQKLNNAEEEENVQNISRRCK